jgi:hypothetical protein
MRPFKRTSRLQHLIATVKQARPGRPSAKTVKAGMITVGGLVGVTAGSASISSLRRRSEEPAHDS